ncbi:hypothetical protein BANRA_00072 [Acinetobacter baumannii]|nr:hypothetical protein BANRA_00072 [Acinetobacter baumannii]
MIHLIMGMRLNLELHSRWLDSYQRTFQELFTCENVISFTKPLLQRALNLLNRQGKEDWVDLKVDGEYGPATLQALIKYIKNRGKEGEKVLVRLLNIMQGQRYIEITETNPKHEQFFYGWLANRISL